MEINLNTLEIEIVDIQLIDGGVQVFARAWNGAQQIGFGVDGTVDIERFRIFNPPILVEDESGTIEKTIDKGTAKNPVLVVERYREDPEQALLQAIVQILQVMKNKYDGSAIVAGKIGNTTSSFYPSMDGYARYNSTGTTWASIIANNGTQANTSFTNISWQISGHTGVGVSSTFDVLARPFIVWDTSSIPDGDTISSATLSLYGMSGTNEFSVEPTMTIMGATLASDATIASSDFQGTFSNQTPYCDTAKAYADFSFVAYNDFALNATGIAAISKTGNTRMGMRFVQDVTGGTTPQQATGAREFGVNMYSVDETGTSKDPLLVVEHASSSAIKSWNSIVRANLKTLNGVASANIKTINGVT